ncbi:MAG: sulfotransferase [Alphaproteobacteria bacterium]|nr:MAG: sulfotransferase [Alphaproteobacteria bacterium]
MAARKPVTRDAYRFVFIVTYGRSGSTLLNRVLNTIPGYLIRGENNAALLHLFRYLESLRATRREFSRADTGPDHPWYGAERIRVKRVVDEALDGFVRNVLRPEPDSRVLGFKEIRHTRWVFRENEFPRYIAFLLRHFPDARIVFNRRSWEAVSRSGWWANAPKEKVRDLVERADALFLTAMLNHPEQCFGMVYEDYDGNPGTFARLFEFLGEPFDEAAVRAVLDERLDHARAG